MMMPTTNQTTPLIPSSTPQVQTQRKTSISGLSQYVNPNVAEKARMVVAAHESSLLRGPSVRGDTYKTVMCQTWLETANCGFGANCKFAHGETELRVTGHPLPINRKYKTRLCMKYTVRGICPYGARCLFIHPDPAEQTMPQTQGMGQCMNPWMYPGAFGQQQMPSQQHFANPWAFGANRPPPQQFYHQPSSQPQERAGPLFVNPHVPFRGHHQRRPMPNIYQQPFADSFLFPAPSGSASSQQSPSPPSIFQEPGEPFEEQFAEKFAEKCSVDTAKEQDKEPKKMPSRRPSQNLLPGVLEELRTEKRVEKREEHKRQIFQMLDKPGPSMKPPAEQQHHHEDKEDEQPAPQDTSIDDGQKETLASTLASVLDFSAGSGLLNSSR